MTRKQIVLAITLFFLTVVISFAQEESAAEELNATARWSALFWDVRTTDQALNNFQSAPEGTFASACADAPSHVTIEVIDEIEVNNFLVGFGVCDARGNMGFYTGQYLDGEWQDRRYWDTLPPFDATTDNPAEFTEETTATSWTIDNSEGVILLFPLPETAVFETSSRVAWRIYDGIRLASPTRESIGCTVENAETIYQDGLAGIAEISMHPQHNFRTSSGGRWLFFRNYGQGEDMENCWGLQLPFLNWYYSIPLIVQTGDFFFFDTGEGIGLFVLREDGPDAVAQVDFVYSLNSNGEYTTNNPLAIVFTEGDCSLSGVCARTAASYAEGVELWVEEAYYQEEYDPTLYDQRGYRLDYLESYFATATVQAAQPSPTVEITPEATPEASEAILPPVEITVEAND